MKRTLTISRCTRTWTPQSYKPPRRTFTSQAPGIHIATFKDSFSAEKPHRFTGAEASPTYTLPAFHKWFQRDDKSTSFSPYMDAFHPWIFPYELIKPSTRGSETISRLQNSLLESQDAVDRDLAAALPSATSEEEEGGAAPQQHQFFQLYAPLRLLIKALEFNTTIQRLDANPPVQLYIAQSLLTDLPAPLQDDVPTPEVIRSVGKGDIYSSSIWLGTEPTYTPLHRDPNPNLFCQLCSSKVVRLLPPNAGLLLYNGVQRRLRQSGNSRMRSTEMMEGGEREMLHRAVWEEDAAADCEEVKLRAGDALFIPKGWWHSIKSEHAGGHLNGSVNWWFR